MAQTFITEKSEVMWAVMSAPKAMAMRKQLHLRGRHGDGHELRIVPARADERQHRLHQGDAKREDQSVMAELGDHGLIHLRRRLRAAGLRIAAPQPLLLELLGHLGRHIFLVMLGEHAVGMEHAVRL